MAAWPTELAAAHPVLRTLQASGAVVYATNAIAQLRTRLILEDEGLVIARALRRTRIPWADVREVRVRGLDLGRRGWIEVVRQNGREVFLPAPVEAFPLLQERWQRTAGVLATSHSPAVDGSADVSDPPGGRNFTSPRRLVDLPLVEDSEIPPRLLSGLRGGSMATSDVTGVEAGHAPVTSDLAPALGRLAEAALQAAAAKLSHKVDGWIRKIEEYADSEGATGRAAVEGLKAHLLGKNPVWAAMKGAWWGASVPLRFVAVLVLLLVLLLAPLVLLLLLLGLLVAAIVAGIRAATR